MRNHNKEKKTSFAFISVSYLIWSWDKKKIQDATVFSWTVNCSKAGNETSLFDLKLVFLCVLNALQTHEEKAEDVIRSRRIFVAE